MGVRSPYPESDTGITRKARSMCLVTWASAGSRSFQGLATSFGAELLTPGPFDVHLRMARRIFVGHFWGAVSFSYEFPSAAARCHVIRFSFNKRDWWPGLAAWEATNLPDTSMDFVPSARRTTSTERRRSWTPALQSLGDVVWIRAPALRKAGRFRGTNGDRNGRWTEDEGSRSEVGTVVVFPNTLVLLGDDGDVFSCNT